MRACRGIDKKMVHRSATAKNAPFTHVNHQETPDGVLAHKSKVVTPSTAIGGPTTKPVHRWCFSATCVALSIGTTASNG